MFSKQLENVNTIVKGSDCQHLATSGMNMYHVLFCKEKKTQTVAELEM